MTQTGSRISGWGAAAVAIMTVLALSAPALRAQTPDTDRLEPQGDLVGLERFLGRWELRTLDLRPDGTRAEGRARSHAYLILDGHVLVDDFRQLGPDGEVIFRGTSIRTADPERDGYLIKWIMVGYPGHTLIRAHWESENVLAMEGEGFDPMGEFLERAEYVFDGADAYRFSLDRSYDGGESWIEDFGIIEARRVGR